MNEERARRINALFGETLDREPSEREAYLESACSPDTRGEVEALLAAHREMGDFLGQPAPEQFVAHGLASGAVVGSYRIVAVLGSGGGGTVYEAEQKSPQRRVALKVRKSGIGSDTSLRRFREEAEILARLEHPDIAHVYEAGVHEGLPFIALELVRDARTLVEHARGLDPASSLRLFVRVCEAVHHGHVNGIVHRDLKPANILVLPSGHPKVIDFGIARVEGIGASPGEIVGTPPWMSPEQCVPGGVDVDARSDVYSLGVILYELLTGRLPHDVKGLPITEATRRIREEPPCDVGEKVPRDFRAIVAKALAREPERRYASAAALAQDVALYLDHRPVAARRARWPHHARLFVRRHRALAVSLLALFLVLIGGAVVSTVFAYRAAAARDREQLLAYIANIAAADSALRLPDVPEAARRLAQAPPALRGWEWGYLAGQLDRSEQVIRDPEASLLYAAPDPAGERIVALGAIGRRGIVSSRDARTARELVRREVPRPPSASPLLSPDGGIVAWGSFDGTIEFADARTLAPLREAKGEARIHDLAFRPDGRVLASASDGKGVALFDVATAKRLPFEGGGRERCYAVRFSPDGTVLAISVEGHAIELRDAATGTLRRTLAGHDSRVVGLWFSGDGRRLVSASTDATVRVWDAATGAQLDVLAGRTRAAILSGSMGAGTLFTGHADGTATLWDLRARTARNILWGHGAEVNSAALLADGRRAVTASRDGTVRIWDVRAPERTSLGTFKELVRDVAWSRDGRWLAAAAFDGTVRLHDLASEPPRERVLAGHANPRVQCVAFHPGSARLASGGGDNAVRIWDCALGACSSVVQLESGILSLAFSPDGRRLAAGTDRRVLLLDAETGKPAGELPHDDWVWAVAFAPDGTLAAASRAGTLRAWAPGGRELCRARVHEGELSCAAFTADGAALVVGGESRVHILDARAFRRTATFDLPVTGIQGVAPSPDGSRIAVAATGSLRLLDPRSGETVLDLRDHRTFLWAVAFDPDGTRIATAAGGYAGEESELRILGSLRPR